MWLQSVEGQHKKEADATQRSRQVLFVLMAVPPDELNLNDLFNKEMIRDVWLTPFSTKREPGTTKNYLGALKLYFQFLLCDHPSDVVFEDQLAENMIRNIDNWKVSFRKKCKKREYEVQQRVRP